MSSTVPAVPAGLFNYDANDRLATDAYDNNGNTTVNASITNTYDFENHLVQRGFINIVYDGDGNRVSKTAGGVTTKYLVDTNNLTGYAQVLEEIVSGSVARNYTYGLDLVSKRETGNSQLSFYGYDGHGSVRQLTDASGTVTDTYDYDAFGNLINRTGTTNNNYLYAGEQFDPDLNLYYNRARYLDVRVGRFWGMDEYEGDSQSPTSLHKYLYASADPVNRIDPSGRVTDLVLAALYGQRVHELIGEDFEVRTGGFSNTSLKTIAGIPSYVRPDLVHPLTGEVYEIKPAGAFAQGLAQLTLYLGLLNILDPEKRRWVPGFSYLPPPILRVTDFTLAFVQVPLFGVITYRLRNLALDVAIVSVAATYHLSTQFATAALTARFAY